MRERCMIRSDHRDVIWEIVRSGVSKYVFGEERDGAPNPKRGVRGLFLLGLFM